MAALLAAKLALHRDCALHRSADIGAACITHSILVVEDDPLILMTAAEALRAAGFHVIEAESADEAAAILRAAATPVAMVFSDIETPGELDGVELANVICKAWPRMSVVLTSGRVKPCPSTLPQGVRFVPKPYDPAYVAVLMGEIDV